MTNHTETIIVNDEHHDTKFVFKMGWFEYVIGIKCRKISSYLTDIIFKPKYKVEVTSYNGLDFVRVLQNGDRIELWLKEDASPSDKNQIILWEKDVSIDTCIDIKLV